MLPLTNRERRAVMTVAFVVFISALVQWMRPHKIKTNQFDYTLQDSLFKVLSADTVHADFQATDKHNPKPLKKLTRAAKRQSKKKILAPHSINPNTASARQLELLPRIGPKTATAIVRYRQEHGPFHRIEELDNIKRIGPKTIERIRPFLILTEQKEPVDSTKSAH